METDKKEIKKFYGAFAGDKYLTEIRRFGLRYDEMIETIVDLLSITSPKEILDIGCGIGNIEELIFEKLPNSKITCIELSSEMASVSKERLIKFQNKVNIICQDILNFESKQKFDVIFSNLVIHNLSIAKKKELLKKIRTWLKPNGIFIWGEFMDWKDKEIDKHFMDYRKKVILESGADKKIVEDILVKEEKDPRLTVIETIDLLRKVGFKNPEVLWVYSFLAVFWARKMNGK